jgi:tRNA threonylcarbamoyladenosine biosynthesis protein TsaE
MKKISFNSYSAKDTISLAKKLAGFLHKGDAVGLFGDLGSGKTTFVKGLAAGLGLKIKVNSPSFVILKIYSRNIKSDNISLYHFDLYRLKTLKELEDIGYEDFINNRGVCVIEWADRADKLLPRDRLEVRIKIKEGGSREIKIIAYGDRYSKPRSPWYPLTFAGDGESFDNAHDASNDAEQSRST